MCGRCALFALLVYVTLDLSLPAMPGAFVFEPSGSIEGAQTNRGRSAGDVVPFGAPLERSFLVTPQTDDADGSTPVEPIGRTVHDIVSRLPRAALAPAPPSEDPQ